SSTSTRPTRRRCRCTSGSDSLRTPSMEPGATSSWAGPSNRSSPSEPWPRPSGRLHGAQQLDRLAQVGHLGGRLALVGLELLLATVDPDDRDLRLHARLDVVVV